jgi:tetratricopeptide (TPR) repeat protein
MNLKTKFGNLVLHRLFVLFFVATFASTSQSSEAIENGKMKRMGKQVENDLERASDRLLTEAMSEFERGNYWECARDLIIQLDFYPNYSKSDQVVFILGECLFEIGLYDGAEKLYKHLVKKYIRSPLLPRALLGLQKIEYVRGDQPRCIEFYNAIYRAVPEESIMDASRYYAGMSFYKIKDYNKAIQLLSLIDSKSEYYDYGQYSTALALLRLKHVRQSIERLSNITKRPVTNDERRAVIDDSHLTLGYIYYELGYYDKALKDFRSVSASHQNHADALLAEGWAAAQLGLFQDAIRPLTRLISSYPELESNEEAFFLLGRCYLKLNKFDEALTVYEHLIEVFPERDVVPAIIKEVKENLETESLKIEKIKMDLLVLETKLLDTLPLSEKKTLPVYIQTERSRITEAKEGLLRRIETERRDFNEMLSQIESLKSLMTLRENRRDWRAYAEYGKSRALFLKRMQ